MSRGMSLKQKEEIVISYNKLAMEQLQLDSFENAMSYLKQALMGIKGIPEESVKGKLMAITFNNLGCLFKRSRNFNEALKYLYKAVDLENKLPNEAATIAGAHLNICSILSQQKDHVKALRHGLRSIFLLKSVYQDQPKHVPTLIIAYHNAAGEYKFIGQIEDAEDCLRVALKIGTEYLGTGHNLTVTVKDALNAISKRKSPAYDYFAKVQTPRTRFPTVSAKSRAQSQDSRKSLYREKVKKTDRSFYRGQSNSSRAKVVKKIEIQRPFVPKMFADEEISIKTDKSFSSINSALRKIDLQQHKATEKTAAVMIQSVWRGYVARKVYNDMKISFKLKQAELKARRAVEEYEKLKQKSVKKRQYAK